MSIRCALPLLALIHVISGSSQKLFASDFSAPQPPAALLVDYQATYVQHKWDATGITHIGAGTIYASTSAGKLRIDVAYEGNLASSLFDYSKANADGSIPNMIYTLAPTAASGACTQYNVTPAFPLFPANILSQYKATFVGLVTDDLFYANEGPLQAWNLIMGGQVSVTAYIKGGNTMVRMDFAAVGLSTFTTTRLFNIAPGAPAANLLGDPCPRRAAGSPPA